MKNKNINKILSSMKEHKLSQLIVTSPSSIYYLTGKWIEPGERLCAVFINDVGTKKFILNELFPIENDTDFDTVYYNDNNNPIEKIVPLIDAKSTLGVDKNWQSAFLIRLMDRIKGISVINGSFIVDNERMVKGENEKELMREASKVNDKAVDKLVNVIKSESVEIDLARKLRSFYEQLGTMEFSFEPLIAFGKNGAEPHHSSDKTVLKSGDSIIMDIGGKTNGYCSDMTRTVFYKSASDKQREVYNKVLEANLKGIEAVKAGVKFSDIDRAARSVIEKAGYGKYFTHRTGHNVGIDVHEPMDVSSANDEIVKEGMIFSIEPGIYLPGEFGVRIEDLVLVTKDGCEVLNSYDKKLRIIE